MAQLKAEAQKPSDGQANSNYHLCQLASLKCWLLSRGVCMGARGLLVGQVPAERPSGV